MERLNLIWYKVAALRLFYPTVYSVLFETGSYYCDIVSAGKRRAIRFILRSEGGDRVRIVVFRSEEKGAIAHEKMNNEMSPNKFFKGV